MRGRGREFRGENPYLATTSGAGEGSMDFNPYSKQNEIHTTDLEGYPGSGDIAYRLFADVANAHGFNLPTADTLMSNNNVRRPWQTVAATMRLKNPDVLSPINSGGAASAYGMDTELWPHLKDRERIGANILRHTHNMLVSRPGNRGRSSKIMVSNGRMFDNLAPLPNGQGFVAKFEPNHPNGVPKGEVIDFNELETRMKSANAIGGNVDSDVEAGRKGGSGTSMAFALMSQLVLDGIENNSYSDVDPTLVEAGSKMGRNREGWFFDKTDEQKAITEMVRQFADEQILPNAEHFDHEDEFPTEIVEQLKELGLFGVTIPEEYGGMGLDLTTYVMIVEELSRGWISISGVINTHFIGSYLLVKYGTEEQKQKYLPRMATGEIRAAFSLSEPEMGLSLIHISEPTRPY